LNRRSFLSGKVEYIQESRDFRKVFRFILSFVCVSEMVPSCRQRRPGNMGPGLGNGPFIYFMRAEDHLTETEERRWCISSTPYRRGCRESEHREFILFLTDGSESEHREFILFPMEGSESEDKEFILFLTDGSEREHREFILFLTDGSESEDKEFILFLMTSV